MCAGKPDLRELHRKALAVAEKLGEEERKLIREIAGVSPNIVYLGYIPVYLRGASGFWVPCFVERR